MTNNKTKKRDCTQRENSGDFRDLNQYQADMQSIHEVCCLLVKPLKGKKKTTD
jgi:hypothetical protein